MCSLNKSFSFDNSSCLHYRFACVDALSRGSRNLLFRASEDPSEVDHYLPHDFVLMPVHSCAGYSPDKRIVYESAAAGAMAGTFFAGLAVGAVVTAGAAVLMRKKKKMRADSVYKTQSDTEYGSTQDNTV